MSVPLVSRSLCARSVKEGTTPWYNTRRLQVCSAAYRFSWRRSRCLDAVVGAPAWSSLRRSSPAYRHCNEFCTLGARIFFRCSLVRFRCRFHRVRVLRPQRHWFNRAYRSASRARRERCGVLFCRSARCAHHLRAAFHPLDHRNAASCAHSSVTIACCLQRSERRRRERLLSAHARRR